MEESSPPSDPSNPSADERFLEGLVPLLYALSDRLRGHMVAVTAAVGLAPPIAIALRALEPGRPRPMSGLAETLGCDPSNVTGIADRLEAHGLVARQPAAHDRRVKELVVTTEGAAVQARFRRELQRVPLRVAALDEAERATLVDLLGRLLGELPDPDASAMDVSSAGIDRTTADCGTP